jgi:hypothetical protein
MEDLERGVGGEEDRDGLPQRDHRREIDIDGDLPSQLLSLKSSSLSEPLYTPPPSSNSSRSRRTVSYDDSYQLRNPPLLGAGAPAIEPSDHRGWRDLLPLPLLRRITSTSSTAQGTTIEVFYCDICLENHPVTESIRFIGCQCRFCRSSLKTFYESQIRDGLIQFFCPTCHTQVTEQEIQTIVSSEMYSKYLRFLEMKSNPSYRECPKCGQATIGSIDHLNITCTQCSESFCFLHSNAHPGRTCQQYMRAQRKIESQNRATIKRMSRKCPSCGCDTEKSGGCNHMTCRACGEVSDLSPLLHPSPFSELVLALWEEYHWSDNTLRYNHRLPWWTIC